MVRYIFTLLILLASISASATKYYLAPTTATPAGSDSNSGTIASPWFTLEKAWTATLYPGDTIYLRGGTYSFEDNQILTGKSGDAVSYINVWAYPGETPIITKAGTFTYATYYSGITISGSYLYLKGIEIKGFVQESNESYDGLYARNVSYSKFEELNIHHNGNGMLIREVSGTATGNLILNCDFHHNYDPLTSPTAYGNADGLAIAQISRTTLTNTIRGCRAYFNSDDGFDFYNNEGYVTIDSCWAYYNGYREDKATHGGDGNGIKLGDTTTDSLVFARTVRNNLLFGNYLAGMTQNGCGKRMYIYNNTCYSNDRGISFNIAYGDVAVIVRNNIAYNNTTVNGSFFGMTLPIYDHNSWQSGYTTTDADFVSLDTTGVSGARGSDGSLPFLNFMKLVSGSDLVNTGIYVGISYSGTAPDLGAFEYDLPVSTTGLGWEPVLSKRNFKEDVNLPQSKWMIDAEPVTTTATELNYNVGVTSGIQGQIDAKAALSAPAFTTSITVTPGDTTVTAVVGKIVYKTSDNHLYICRQLTAKKWYQLDN